MDFLLKVQLRIGAMISVVLGILSINEAIKLYPYSSKLFTGDHTFPGIIGITLVIAGMILFIKPDRAIEKGSMPTGKIRNRMVFTIIILLVYCYLISYIGYFLSTLLTFTVLIKMIGNYRWVKSSIIAILFTTFLYYLFVYLLKIPLPTIYFPL